MKRTFTLLVTLLVTLQLFAGIRDTKLSVSGVDKPIRFMLDGHRFQPGNRDNNMVLIQNLTPGFHSIRIFQLKRVGRQNTYEQIYSSQINLKAQFIVDVVVSRYGKVYIDEQRMSIYDVDDNDWQTVINNGPTIDQWNNNFINNNGNNNNVWNNNNNNNNNGWNNNNNNNNGWNNNNNNNNGYNWNGNNWNANGWNGTNRPMNDQSFQQLKQTLTNEAFDDTRSTIAKQVLGINYFTSEQVRQLVKLFTFDTGKLDIAKFAYKNTVDRGNYYVIYPELTFSSSKDNLAKYIQAFR
ncbi:MAG: DUF4476 domain-containing protein [Ferruginibacter sp.]